MAENVLTVLLDFLKLIYFWMKSIIVFFLPEHLFYKDISTDTVLITGGASGFGQLLAVKFAELGCKVIVIDVNEAGLQETKKLVNKFAVDCLTFKCDLSNREQVYQTVAKIKSTVDFVSILVNNAGIVSGKSVLNINDDDLEKLFKVNTLSHFWLVKSFLPDMVKHERGHIVSIASACGLFGNAWLTDYSASKFAAVGFNESLLLETYFQLTDKINFTTVCPYYMNTGMFHGVQSKTMPILEPSYVAEKTISAIRLNQTLLLTPRIIYFLWFLKTLLPDQCALLMVKMFEGHMAMKTFQGRQVNLEKNDINENKIK